MVKPSCSSRAENSASEGGADAAGRAGGAMIELGFKIPESGVARDEWFNGQIAGLRQGDVVAGDWVEMVLEAAEGDEIDAAGIVRWSTCRVAISKWVCGAGVPFNAMLLVASARLMQSVKSASVSG